jgi:hypothetical protein
MTDPRRHRRIPLSPTSTNGPPGSAPSLNGRTRVTPRAGAVASYKTRRINWFGSSTKSYVHFRSTNAKASPARWSVDICDRRSKTGTS